MIQLARARIRNVAYIDGDDAWLVLVGEDGAERGRTVVDRDVFEVVHAARWGLHSQGYAVGVIANTTDRIYLHRWLLDDPPGLLVGHIDGDRLNNRRRNLRPLTLEQSPQNQVPTVGSSAHRGVYFEAFTQRWRAAVQISGRSHKSPRFTDLSDAVAWACAKRGEIMPFQNAERHHVAVDVPERQAAPFVYRRRAGAG